MKRILVVFLLSLTAFSCQKGIVWQSEGELQKDNVGMCLPVSVGGTYSVNQLLADSNYLTVSVNVTLPGTYNIYTDTVNGYSFKAAGTFESKGVRSVKMIAVGKPVISGINNFSIFYNQSVCEAAVTVVGKDSVTPPVSQATYIFKDENNNCQPVAVNGYYVANNLLDTFNTVFVPVNVIAPGTFSITTDTVNGYYFSASGTFSSTGNQSIKLMAHGSPMNEGTNVFSLQDSVAVCHFSVSVVVAEPVTSNDLLPLAINNRWVYDDLINKGDSIVRTVTGTTQENGNSYFVVKQRENTDSLQYLFRKQVIQYFEYARIDKYTNSFQYSQDIDTDLVFLNEVITTGASWESVEIKNTASFGQIIFLKYYFVCTGMKMVITINGKTFANVYEFTMQPEIRSEYAGYGLTGELYTFYYAKGIGLIYMRQENQYSVSNEMQIRNWKIN